MKRVKQGKENRRNGANFFKYVQPQSMTLSQQSRLHCRSVMQLDQNSARYQQSARVGNKKQLHHSSLGIPAESVDTETVKSHSLKKFLTMFGGSINTNQTQRRSTTNEQKQKCKSTGKQVFTCNIKNVNVNVSHSSRQKQLKVKAAKDKKVQNCLEIKQTSRNNDQEVIAELKKQIEQDKKHQASLKKQIQGLKKDNQILKLQLESHLEQLETKEQQFQQTERQLKATIERLTKKVAEKDKCRQHQLIIQSLKKVINEQLKKIIELEKLKIEREQIQKLEDKISKNIGMFNSTAAKEKMRQIEDNDILTVRRKEGSGIIRLQEDYFSNTEQSSPVRDHEVYSEPIVEVTQEQEQESMAQTEQDDSILEQVDKYLTQWRGKP